MEKNDNTVKRIVLSNDIQVQPANSIDITELSNDQKYAFNLFKNGSNLFITGPGGTGKTKLIKYLLDYAISIKRVTQVCAMTGCAAILLNCNARTLHSWSGIKLAKGPKNKIIESVLKNKRIVAQWKKTKCLIIDEVSMLSKKIFIIIEEIARKTKHIELPFGGMQVIFTGDFYQLPPVGSNSEIDTQQFCFETPLWNQVFPIENHINLTHIFRQNDNEYINILQQVRIGNIDNNSIETLHKYVKRDYDPSKHNNCIPTKLFPLRSKVDYVNNTMFTKIQEKEYVFTVIKKQNCYTYIESNKNIPLELKCKSDKLKSTEIEYELDALINNSPCVNTLRLKKGSVIMCNVNLDLDNGICNGSQGIITDIIEDKTKNTIIPVVQFVNGIKREIQPYYWQSEEYPSLAIGQYPLCLAWALTIHKIQGATLDMAEIDIGQSIFEYGQTYVALSRIKSLDGLYLSAFQPQKICANPIINTFYENIPKINYTDIDVSVFNLKDYELKEESYQEYNSIKKILLN